MNEMDVLYAVAALLSCFVIVAGLCCIISTTQRDRYGDVLMGFFIMACGMIGMRYVVMYWGGL